MIMSEGGPSIKILGGLTLYKNFGIKWMMIYDVTLLSKTKNLI